MLAICERGDVEERLIVSVGIAVGGVSNKSPKLDITDRVTDVCPSGRDVFGYGGVYCNVPNLN